MARRCGTESSDSITGSSLNLAVEINAVSCVTALIGVWSSKSEAVSVQARHQCHRVVARVSQERNGRKALDPKGSWGGWGEPQVPTEREGTIHQGLVTADNGVGACLNVGRPSSQRQTISASVRVDGNSWRRSIRRSGAGRWPNTRWSSAAVRPGRFRPPACRPRLPPGFSGLPLSIGISAANLHDSQALIPLVQGIPPIRSRRGPPTPQARQTARR